MLVESYNALKATGRPFEIVFVSSDRDQAAFDEYYGEMPWLALPFSDRDGKARLSSQYKVSGIPTFVIVDAEGKTITTDGRSCIMEDPQGADFPWTPPTLEESLGESFVKADGSTITRASLAGKTLALYFSAHWCGPCRGFTPKLKELYESMKAAGRDDFEFIFVSSDRDQAAFDQYLGEMPWCALPFSNRKGKAALSKRFQVEGIPTLVTIDAQGNTINKDARGAAGADPKGAEFPWHPKPINDLASGPGGIQETPSLCLLMEKCSAEKQAELEAALAVPANAAAAKLKANPGSDPTMLFFTAKNEGGIGARLRQMCNLGDAEPDKASLFLLDLPDNGGFYVHSGGEVTAESIATFLEFFKAGALERQQLRG